MVYMGTLIASGKPGPLSLTRGMQTELGKIAGMIQEIQRFNAPAEKLEQFGSG
jgi:hypothetical protein